MSCCLSSSHHQYEIAQVTSAYVASGSEQLSLAPGQLILILKKNTSGWWQGELQARGKKRQKGWFPASHVKLLGPSSERATPAFHPVCQVIAMYDYAANNEDELSFSKGQLINVMNKDDPDWWQGEINGVTEWKILPDLLGLEDLWLVIPVDMPVRPYDPMLSSSCESTPETHYPSFTLAACSLLQYLMQPRRRWDNGATNCSEELELGEDEFGAPMGCPNRIIEQVDKIKIYSIRYTPLGGMTHTLSRFSHFTTKLQSLCLLIEQGSELLSVIQRIHQRLDTDSFEGRTGASGQTDGEEEERRIFIFFPDISGKNPESEGRSRAGNLKQRDEFHFARYLASKPLLLAPQQPHQADVWISLRCADLQTLDTMQPIERKRQGYIHELIQTEERYMGDLQLVVEVFQKRMAESGFLTEGEMALIFVNWKELIMSNTKLLKALRVRKKTGGEKMPVQMIGDILAAELSHMQAYIRFCSCQLNGAALLQQKTDEDTDFKEFLKVTPF
ncbi:hypothetical protein P7K49_028617 [Saguinus oedipus]|uniref:Uncharacterized protein n=1 Tax=Saguinus oedipus TaxID=9490 RepID=A0ABQ9U4V2_SAGOE|nr:hypothetical protein P7K49_028617 [Saguinus oedipus]